jgi:hypothetical protein
MDPRAAQPHESSSLEESFLELSQRILAQTNQVFSDDEVDDDYISEPESREPTVIQPASSTHGLVEQQYKPSLPYLSRSETADSTLSWKSDLAIDKFMSRVMALTKTCVTSKVFGALDVEDIAVSWQQANVQGSVECKPESRPRGF